MTIEISLPELTPKTIFVSYLVLSYLVGALICRYVMKDKKIISGDDYLTSVSLWIFSPGIVPLFIIMFLTYFIVMFPVKWLLVGSKEIKE